MLTRIPPSVGIPTFILQRESWSRSKPVLSCVGRLVSVVPEFACMQHTVPQPLTLQIHDRPVFYWPMWRFSWLCPTAKKKKKDPALSKFYLAFLWITKASYVLLSTIHLLKPLSNLLISILGCFCFCFCHIWRCSGLIHVSALRGYSSWCLEIDVTMREPSSTTYKASPQPVILLTDDWH